MASAWPAVQSVPNAVSRRCRSRWHHVANSRVRLAQLLRCRVASLHRGVEGGVERHRRHGRDPGLGARGEVDRDHHPGEEGADLAGREVHALAVAGRAEDRGVRGEDDERRGRVRGRGAQGAAERQERIEHLQAVNDPDRAPREGTLLRQRRLARDLRRPAPAPFGDPVLHPLRVEVRERGALAQGDDQVRSVGCFGRRAVDVEEPEVLDVPGRFVERHPEAGWAPQALLIVRHAATSEAGPVWRGRAGPASAGAPADACRTAPPAGLVAFPP